ncbi:MAG: MBL fold metallo-hydrolase [Deferribacteraceae bacterium]|jgi:glyoxylase-like metal-dependent hydrolase (beta-lactamase superfamily II)|nr:MBL fold metallo-hydrolase [Deferribacteraceae bacterium]
MQQGISFIDLGATLIGIIDADSFAIVVDSGISNDHAKKIAKAAGKPVKVVLLTHLHADHTGGASFFAKGGAEVYISKYELSFIINHELNTALLYGGIPPKMYRRPFFLSESVNAIPFEHEIPIEIGGVKILPIKTDGHSIGHTSFLVGSTLFAGDALTSPNVTAKHKLIYNYCPVRALAALERIKQLDFTETILCHKDIIDKKTAINYACLQREHILSVYADLKEIINGKPAGIETITELVCKKRGLNISQDSYLLAISTIKGYLSDMEARGDIAVYFEDGRILFS